MAYLAVLKIPYKVTQSQSELENVEQEKTKNKTKNRPFYSCELSNLAFEWTWGWGWPCFDTNFFPFLMVMMFKKYQLE